LAYSSDLTSFTKIKNEVYAVITTYSPYVARLYLAVKGDGKKDNAKANSLWVSRCIKLDDKNSLDLDNKWIANYAQNLEFEICDDDYWGDLIP
jgi:hypothetical protein